MVKSERDWPQKGSEFQYLFGLSFGIVSVTLGEGAGFPLTCPVGQATEYPEWEWREDEG